MIGTLTYRPLQVNRQEISVYASYDPTKTTALRNQFARDMKKRFDVLCKDIQTKVVDEDCFGLNETKIQFNTEDVTTYAGGSVSRSTFAFPRSQDKVNGFMAWLDTQTKEGILSIKQFDQVGQSTESAWTNMYIGDSYKRGVIRARYELDKSGFSIPTIEETGGVAMSMATPFHMDRVGLLYSRTFSELKGITAAMDSQISRILAQGIADGDNPRLLARKMIATINGTGMGDLTLTDKLGRFIPALRRAEMLARTEIIRAHHQATIQEYKNWAVEGVIVQGEWLTAEDGRVCSQCKEMTGKVFTLAEIEPLIPLHPGCRCIALPKNVEKKVEETGKITSSTTLEGDWQVIKNIKFTDDRLDMVSDVVKFKRGNPELIIINENPAEIMNARFSIELNFQIEGIWKDGAKRKMNAGSAKLLGAYDTDKKILSLTNIYVDDKFRRKGIATFLNKKAVLLTPKGYSVQGSGVYSPSGKGLSAKLEATGILKKLKID